jgi:NAD(P)-dependent dehydrogenase (short-subunit alcohol dehydrogenase family)
VAFAKEGADVAIGYLSEHDDAHETERLVKESGRRCVLLPGDLSDEGHCRAMASLALSDLGGIDLLVNNLATQKPQERFEDITTEQWMRTFDVNIHTYFFMTRAVLPHLGRGASIINTASINGLRGNAHLIDYSATKGAILAFTYSLAQALIDRGIRVNSVAPGPVWTPLIPSTMDPEQVASFGQQAPLGRAAQPDEIAPSYVFFASGRLSSYYSGEVLAPIGGETLPG